MPFVTLNDGRKIFVRDKHEGISRRVENIYGKEIADDPKVKRAGSFEQAQKFARDRVVSGAHRGGIQHNIRFLSPERASENPTELREIIGSSPNVIKFNDELFRRKLEEEKERELARNLPITPKRLGEMKLTKEALDRVGMSREQEQEELERNFGEHELGLARLSGNRKFLKKFDPEFLRKIDSGQKITNADVNKGLSVEIV